MSAHASERKAYRLAVVFSQFTVRRRKRSCQACVRSTTGAPRLGAWMSRCVFLAPALGGDMCCVVLGEDHRPCLRVVEGRIQRQMLWRLACHQRPHHDQVLDQGLKHGRIVDLGSRDERRERDAPPIDQKVVFHSGLCPIGRVGAVLFSPPRAIGHKSHQPLASRRRCRAPHYISADSGARCLRTRPLVSIRRSDPRPSATCRTSPARHATACRSRGDKAWRRAGAGPRQAGGHREPAKV